MPFGGLKTTKHVIADRSQAQALADKPVQLRFALSMPLANPLARVVFLREGRVPERIERLIVLDKQGCFSGWTPDNLSEIYLEAAGELQESAVNVRLRVLSLAEIALKITLKRPASLWRLAKLARAGNAKGAVFRFVRFFEGLNAPNYQRWKQVLPHVKAADAKAAPQLMHMGVRLFTDRADVARLADQLGLQRARVANLVEARKKMAGPLDFWLSLPDHVSLAQHDAMQSSAHGLSRLLTALLATPDASAIYADEEDVDRKGRVKGCFFKPAWNPPLDETGWLRTDAALIRLSSLQHLSLNDLAKGERLVARAAEKGDVLHLPEPVFARKRTKKPAYSPSQPRQIAFGEPKQRMPVSVIIPTRDRADLLAACLEGLINRTQHGGLEIVVVDNDSREDATLQLMSRLEAEGHIVRLAMPGAFNFAKACNLGVGLASHEHILLLNNDVEPLTPDWLLQMQAELQEPQVGAVGPLLLFPDGFVQHAGVTLGHGTIARHTFHFSDVNLDDDQGLIRQRRDVSAVTAACLLTRRSLWQAAGGMNAANLPVAFNDVDYCLKLRRLGHVVRYTPHAALVHHESVSRGRDDTEHKRRRFAAEERYMYENWAEILHNDPYYNPNFSLSAADLSLGAYGRDLRARTSRMALTNPHKTIVHSE